MKGITFLEAIFLLMVLLKIGYNQPYSWFLCLSVLFIGWALSGLWRFLLFTKHAVLIQTWFFKKAVAVMNRINYMIALRKIKKQSGI